MTKDILKTKTVKNLIDLFITTENMPYTSELPTVRGWIMDELEERNPKAFDQWLDLDYPDNESLKRLYL